MDITNKNNINNSVTNILKYNNNNTYFAPSVFCFKNKEDIIKAKGTCYPNINNFINVSLQKATYSHFTPNLYKSGWITENNKLFGHSENNLYQINCFVVDVDSKNIDFKKIIDICKNINLSPNLILNTPKGYHLYYILNKPVYKENFKKAKDISKKIRLMLSEYIKNIDLGCNHFGIFRYPTNENILYENNDFYSFNDFNKDVFLKTKTLNKENIYNNVNNNVINIVQVNSKWFKVLYNIKEIPKKDFLQGRNNVLFTLALACYSSKLSYNSAITKLCEFNKKLKTPLNQDEFIKTIKSAYSGKYKGAEKSHIKRLIIAYVGEKSFNKSLFYQKHKKSRDCRKHSYIYEWKKDFIRWIIKNQGDKKYIKTTHKDISKTTKIPESSLKILISELKKENKLKTMTKKGRNGYTIVSFTPLLYKYLLLKKAESSQSFKKWRDNIESYINIPEKNLIKTCHHKNRCFLNKKKEKIKSSG